MKYDRKKLLIYDQSAWVDSRALTLLITLTPGRKLRNVMHAYIDQNTHTSTKV